MAYVSHVKTHGSRSHISTRPAERTAPPRLGATGHVNWSDQVASLLGVGVGQQPLKHLTPQAGQKWAPMHLNAPVVRYISPPTPSSPRATTAGALQPVLLRALTESWRPGGRHYRKTPYNFAVLLSPERESSIRLSLLFSFLLFSFVLFSFQLHARSFFIPSPKSFLYIHVSQHRLACLRLEFLDDAVSLVKSLVVQHAQLQ